MTTTVTTQKELDDAVAAKKTDIVIDSPAGVWLVLWGSSSAVLRGYSRAVLRDYSSAVLRGSSSAVLRGSSSAVLRGSSRAELRDSSSAELRDYSSAVLRDSSRAVLRDSSSAELWDSSSAEASKYTAVHLHSKRAKFTGAGRLIDVSDIDLNTVADWIEFHGVKVVRGKAVVYKAVDADLNAGHDYTLTSYPIGGKVTAPDWVASQACGHGLHFGYQPVVAARYFTGPGAPRFLAVEIAVKDMIALGDKCKVPSGKVLHEVDVHGDVIAVQS